RAAIQQIIPGAGEDQVVLGVTGDIGGSAAGDVQLLDMGTHGEGRGAAEHPVIAASGQFHHDVANLVDDIGVIAGEADQHVGTRTAVQQVRPRGTADDVGQ